MRKPRSRWNRRSYTPRAAPWEGERNRRNLVTLAAIAIAPGVDYFPGFLRTAPAQEALKEDLEGILGSI